MLQESFNDPATPGYLVLTYHDGLFDVTNTTFEDSYAAYNNADPTYPKVLIDNNGYVLAASGAGGDEHYKYALLGYAAENKYINATMYYDGGWAIGSQLYSTDADNPLPDPILTVYNISDDTVTNDYLNLDLLGQANALIANGFVLDSTGQVPYVEMAIGQYFSRFLGDDLTTVTYI